MNNTTSANPVKRVSVRDIDFFDDLFRVSMALQYNVSDYANQHYHPKSERQRRADQRLEIWQAKSRTNIKGLYQVKLFQRQNADALALNPLINGLLEMYSRVYQVKDYAELKKIYEDYQQIQRDFPYEAHLREYLEAGCCCTGPAFYGAPNGGVNLAYPAYLYTAYCQHGGHDDEHRQGFLYPEQKLSVAELDAIYQIDPYYMQRDPSVMPEYQKMKKHNYQPTYEK